MSEKAEKKPDAAAKKEAAAPAAAVEHGKGGGFLTKVPVLVGGAMLIEAIVLIGGYKVVAGGPKNANAADLTTIEPTTRKSSGTEGDLGEVSGVTSAEIQLLDARFPNKQSGHTFLYDVEMYVSVKQEASDKVKKAIGDHDALIKDRVRTIIAQLDPDKLGGGSEPGLETLRRQVKYQLEEIVGEGLVDDVLVPRCIPFRADY
jgi:flagellar basal body-associated protein FliL